MMILEEFLQDNVDDDDESLRRKEPGLILCVFRTKTKWYTVLKERSVRVEEIVVLLG